MCDSSKLRVLLCNATCTGSVDNISSHSLVLIMAHFAAVLGPVGLCKRGSWYWTSAFEWTLCRAVIILRYIKRAIVSTSKASHPS